MDYESAGGGAQELDDVGSPGNVFAEQTVESVTARSRAALGDEAFEAARAAGRALALESAVAEALS